MTAQKELTLHGRKFRVSIPYEEIHASIVELAKRINRDYADKECPLFLSILNGSFMFTAELMQQLDFQCEISFLKLASYSGTESTGKVQELIGLVDNIKGRHVIILEDIVDTGASIEYLNRSLKGHEPASFEVATLLMKPDAYERDFPIKYVAMEIPNDFIIGFGLDFDQLGRNYKDIYTIVEG